MWYGVCVMTYGLALILVDRATGSDPKSRWH